MMVSMKSKRPLSVTFLAVGVFIFGLGQLWQAGAIYGHTAVLTTLPNTLNPHLRLIAALLWALLAFTLSLTLWRGWAPTRWLIPLAGSAFLLYHLSLITISTSIMAQRGWTGNLLLGSSLLLLTSFILHRPAARPFFANLRD